MACSEILPDEKRGSSLRFLFNALRFFRAQGVKVQRVMTDNGGSFRSRRYAEAQRDCACSQSSTCGPNPIRQRRTGKPSASFKLHFANGPKRLAERIDINTEGPGFIT